MRRSIRDTDLVAVHDAVRPFVDLETIRRVIEEAAVTGAAIVGIVPVDTVKQVSGAQAGGAKVRATISRERLVLAQTPQVFRYDVLRRAFEAARRDNFSGTDESSLVERLDQVEISVVLGSERNIKITRPGDMDLARLFFEQENGARIERCPNRAGLGCSSHCAGPSADSGRRHHSLASSGWRGIPMPMFFRTPSPTRFWARSRAGDIGMHFPDTDPRWKGADSLHSCGTPAIWQPRPAIASSMWIRR